MTTDTKRVTDLTLGELLTSTNETVRRSALSILRTFQKYPLLVTVGDYEPSEEQKHWNAL